MPSESAERRAARAQQLGAPLPSPAEQDPLPCPRCESTNTKFCYYNNYNFSQPRHFCKACRRYWTHGGTLRDIPIGGGTRKSAKRSRTSSSGPTVSTIAAGSHHHQHPPIPATPVFASLSSSGSGSAAASFTSLLMSSTGGGPVNVVGPMGGFGFGVGLGLEEVGFGLGRGVWATTTTTGQVGYGGSVSRGGDTWQVESGGDHQSEFGATGGGDCFASLPELAISTPGNVGLK